VSDYSPSTDNLFPAIYVGGGSYYTVSDGQVWRWIEVHGRGPNRWYERKATRMPADAGYASQAPERLQRAVRAKGGELHRCNLHGGTPGTPEPPEQREGQ